MKNLYFGLNLKYLRRRENIKTTDIFSKIGFHRNTWHGYEVGKSFPSLLDFISIAEYFGISEYDLLHHNLEAGNHPLIESTCNHDEKYSALLSAKDEIINLLKTSLSSKDETISTMSKKLLHFKNKIEEETTY